MDGLVISCFNVSHSGGKNGSTIGGNYCSNCHTLGYVRENCFKMKKNEIRYGHNQVGDNNNSNRDRGKL
jgi:hypothetical protein